MGILAILAALAPYITAGIQLMETLFTEAKSGAVKQSTLTNSINNVLDGFAATSKGGQANTVAAIKPLVPFLIDDAVAVANAAGTLIKGSPVITIDLPLTGPAKSEG